MIYFFKNGSIMSKWEIMIFDTFCDLDLSKFNVIQLGA